MNDIFIAYKLCNISLYTYSIQVNTNNYSKEIGYKQKKKKFPYKSYTEWTVLSNTILYQKALIPTFHTGLQNNFC